MLCYYLECVVFFPLALLSAGSSTRTERFYILKLMYKRLGAAAAVAGAAVMPARRPTEPAMSSPEMAATAAAPVPPARSALGRLAINDFHPVPTPGAQRQIHVAHAFARGHVPANTCVAPLVTGSRSFSTFSGSQRDFFRKVNEGCVMVFFFKPACGPCAAIRSKIMDVKDRLQSSSSSNAHVDGSNSTSGPNGGCSHSSNSNNNNSSGATEVPEGNSNSAQHLCRVETCPLQSSEAGGEKGGMSPDDAATAQLIQSRAESDEFVSATQSIEFIAVNTNDYDVLTALHDIRSLPTFIAYVNGRILGRVEGAQEKELMALVIALGKEAAESSAAPHKSDPSQTVN